ncbi:hypothetical protein ABGT15_04770 [Flavobacterium enshiense]|uniref:hypothetical protein n=1 Tax=Flavobacterium enshiense TaxID=1341165 RepID=UPI00345C6415
MDHTPKDLGEVLETPDMSNFKNPLNQQTGGTITIGSFNITPMMPSDKKESIAEIVKRERRDSGVV